jgi:hypothetical protein
MINPISNVLRGKDGNDVATIGILGDISFHNIIPFTHLFNPLLPVFHNTDLIIANIETVISDKKTNPCKKRGIFLKSPAKSARILKELGINVALLANNHMDDYGAEGILDTISHLEQNDILFFGTKERGRLDIKINDIFFELHGFVTPYDSSEYLLPYGKSLNDVSKITRNNDKAHLLYFLHGFDELYSTPFPWRVELLKVICQKCCPTVLICGHQHIYQGFYLYNDIPICLSCGNGFMNIEYHRTNIDTFIGCYSVLHFDKSGCFQIDEYYYQITSKGILELPNIQYHYNRVKNGISTVDSDKTAWEEECFFRLNEHKYNKKNLIGLLYDIYRFIRYFRKQIKYIHYRSMIGSYIKKKWTIACSKRLLNKQGNWQEYLL